LNTNNQVGSLVIYTKDKGKNPPYQLNDKQILGINPGSSYGDAKRWYPIEYANVISSLSERYNIIILGGPNEEEVAMEIQKLIEKKGVTNFQNLAGKLSISELINCISKFDLFVTGDSGPMHIAASFRVPTISIFGPTKPDETSQWGNKKSVVLSKNLSCQPCMKRKCPLKHHNCMKLIKSDDVLSEVKLLGMKNIF